MLKRGIVAGMAIAMVATSITAQADDDSYGLNDIFTNGHVDGDLRLYAFNRLYDSKTTPNASAFSAAALINAQTGTFFGGFSIGGSFATANSFGTHSDQPAKVDTTLAGPTNSIGTFSQAYLQYTSNMFLFRGGYQYLTDDPWMGNNDSRVIPSSYNALLLQLTPVTGWKLFAIREYSWKSRTSFGIIRITCITHPNTTATRCMATTVRCPWIRAPRPARGKAAQAMSMAALTRSCVTTTSSTLPARFTA
jgi:hypothetical protein